MNKRTIIPEIILVTCFIVASLLFRQEKFQMAEAFFASGVILHFILREIAVIKPKDEEYSSGAKLLFSLLLIPLYSLLILVIGFLCVYGFPFFGFPM